MKLFQAFKGQLDKIYKKLPLPPFIHTCVTNKTLTGLGERGEKSMSKFVQKRILAAGRPGKVAQLDEMATFPLFFLLQTHA